jgi:hypothetical protein
VIWDANGARYGLGAGLHVLVNGQKAGYSEKLGPLTLKLPPARAAGKSAAPVNFFVNNDGDYFPRLTASFTSQRSSLGKLNDGNYWYHLHPPNRWTSEGSPNPTDWVEVDLGVKRPIAAVKLYFLDDTKSIIPPARFDVEYWTGAAWRTLPGQTRVPAQPAGRRANVVGFPAQELQKLRFTFTHAAGGRTGLTEIEGWGDMDGTYQPAPPPPGNLALNLRGEGFPRASASFHDRFGGVPRLANDGKTIYSPNPINRWTSYGSTNQTDWLEVDFGEPKEIGRIELCIYDDRGGVQPPASYAVEIWSGSQWREAPGQAKQPAAPVGSAVNTVTFPTQTTSKFRVVFTHSGKARSGVTEILAWRE